MTTAPVTVCCMSRSSLSLGGARLYAPGMRTRRQSSSLVPSGSAVAAAPPGSERGQDEDTLSTDGTHGPRTHGSATRRAPGHRRSRGRRRARLRRCRGARWPPPGRPGARQGHRRQPPRDGHREHGARPDVGAGHGRRRRPRRQVDPHPRPLGDPAAQVAERLEQRVRRAAPRNRRPAPRPGHLRHHDHGRRPQVGEQEVALEVTAQGLQEGRVQALLRHGHQALLGAQRVRRGRAVPRPRVPGPALRVLERAQSGELPLPAEDQERRQVRGADVPCDAPRLRHRRPPQSTGRPR